MNLSFLDTETTGTDQAAGHRICEIAIVRYDLATRDRLGDYVQRIDPQRPIDAAAQAVHKIAYTDLVGQPTWDQVAPTVSAEMRQADMLIAHNAGFDAPFVTAELARVGARVPNTEWICTMESGRWATFDGKSPKLAELCFALGVDYDPALAHSALYDVERTAECFFKALDRGFFSIPTSVAWAA